MSVEDILDIFVPTSPAPWNPSTETIYNAIDSIFNIVGEALVQVWFDGVPDFCTDAERYAYEEFKGRLESVEDVAIVEMDEWVGLPLMTKMFIEQSEKPVILNFQHDWVVLNPERVDGEELVCAMEDHEEIGVVRLYKRRIASQGARVDTHLAETKEYGIPLIRTNGWGDSCHFARRDHYEKYVLPNMSHDRHADGRYGMEGPVLRAYRRDIKRRGFDAAQRDWGSFLYGSYGDETYIKHIGGEATKWRQSKGFSR